MPEPYLAKAKDLSTLTGLPETDPELLLGLQRASNRFRGDVGYPVHRVSNDVVTLNGSGTRTLLLPAFPVDVHAVAVDGEPLVLQLDYGFDPRYGVLRRRGGLVWPEELGNIQITYSHGWEVIPGDVEDAVLEHAATVTMVLVHVQQNSAGSTQESYGAAAMVGTTAKWAAAVSKYSAESRA